MKPLIGHVFLTDGLLRRALAACRSLGRRGLAITCGEETSLNPTSFSRFCRQRVTYPSPRRSPHIFLAVLLDYLSHHPHECLFPMEEETLDLVLSHRAEFERVTCLPFPHTETFQQCRDKSKTLEMAARAGVLFPRTVLPSGPAQVVEETLGLHLPMVIKPRSSCAGRGLRRVHDRRELAAAYRQVHERYPRPLVQEEIPQGAKFDVCCLLDTSSRPVATFVQREVRGYPLLDGPSSVQESVWWPELVESATGLLQQMGWYGIAEVEFMVDPRDGTPMLMEVNPRFWASLQLAVLCGVDFPYLLYRLARGEQVEPVRNYRVGLMCRSLLPTDLLHFWTNRDRWQMRPGFFDFFNSRCYGDLVSRHDPAPLLGFILSCCRYLLSPAMWQRMIRIGEQQPLGGCDRAAPLPSRLRTEERSPSFSQLTGEPSGGSDVCRTSTPH